MGTTPIASPTGGLISVLMPVGRVDRYVVAAVMSILAQENVSLELILVGPQETDPAYAALQQLIATEFPGDSRLQVMPRQQPGIANALNQAMANAGGDYLARMDADDVCEPDRLLRQRIVSQHHDDACLLSACVRIFSSETAVQGGNTRYELWLNNLRTPEAIRASCLVESPLPHPTWFAHRSVWETLGPYEQADFPEDYDLVLRAWLHRIPMMKPKRVLLHWREHGQRLTRTDTRYRREAFTRLKARALCDAKSGLGLNEGRPIWIAGTGRNARYWHDALTQHNASVAGFVDLERPGMKTQKRHKPVVSYQQLAHSMNDDLLVTAITDANARSQLIDWCEQQHWTLGKHVIIGG